MSLFPVYQWRNGDDETVDIAMQLPKPLVNMDLHALVRGGRKPSLWQRVRTTKNCDLLE